jgi:hypothetical protein
MATTRTLTTGATMTLDAARSLIAAHRELATALLIEGGHEEVEIDPAGEVEADGYTFGRSDLIELATVIADNTATAH